MWTIIKRIALLPLAALGIVVIGALLSLWAICIASILATIFVCGCVWFGLLSAIFYVVEGPEDRVKD